MRIAIDLDGVVFNSDMYFMAMGEIFDCKVLKGDHMICPDEARVQEKYSWTKDEIEEYINNYSCATDFAIMPCAAIVIDEIKKDNEVIFVSARGQFSEEEITIAQNKLNEIGLVADKYFWCCTDKAEFCRDKKIDILIDDNYSVDILLKNTEVIFIYFYMAGKRKLPSRDKLYEVHNWGEIYRILNDLKVIEN